MGSVLTIEMIATNQMRFRNALIDAESAEYGSIAR